MSFVKTFLNWGATKCNEKSYLFFLFAGGSYLFLDGYFKAAFVFFFLGGGGGAGVFRKKNDKSPQVVTYFLFTTWMSVGWVARASLGFAGLRC